MKELISYLKTEKPGSVIPVPNSTLIPLVETRNEVEIYLRLASPRYDIVMETHDKYRTDKKAEQTGIPVPNNQLLQDLGDEKSIKETSEMIRYSMLVKPRMKPSWINERAINLKADRKNHVRKKRETIGTDQRDGKEAQRHEVICSLVFSAAAARAKYRNRFIKTLPSLVKTHPIIHITDSL